MDYGRWCRRSLGVVVLVANEVRRGEEQREALAVHLHHTVAVKGSNELLQTSNRQEPSGLNIIGQVCLPTWCERIPMDAVRSKVGGHDRKAACLIPLGSRRVNYNTEKSRAGMFCLTEKAANPFAAPLV